MVIFGWKFIEGSLNDSFSHLELSNSERDSTCFKTTVLKLNAWNFVTISGTKPRCLSPCLKTVVSILLILVATLSVCLFARYLILDHRTDFLHIWGNVITNIGEWHDISFMTLLERSRSPEVIEIIYFLFQWNSISCNFNNFLVTAVKPQILVYCGSEVLH